MKKYKYLLFDLDGTVTDPKEGITKSVAYALAYFGIVVEDLDTLCDFIGPPLTDSFSKYFDLSKKDSVKAVEKYREYYTKKGMLENVLYEGIDNLLKKASENDMKIILATSKPEPFAKLILEYFNIDKYFDFVAGSLLDLTRLKKAEVIEHIINNYPIIIEETLMIGDTVFDVEGAKTHGITSLSVLYGYGKKEDLEMAGTDYIVSNLAEVEAFLGL